MKRPALGNFFRIWISRSAPDLTVWRKRGGRREGGRQARETEREEGEGFLWSATAHIIPPDERQAHIPTSYFHSQVTAVERWWTADDDDVWSILRLHPLDKLVQALYESAVLVGHGYE